LGNPRIISRGWAKIQPSNPEVGGRSSEGPAFNSDVSRASTACQSAYPRSHSMFRSRGKSRSRAPATLSPTSSGESFIQKKFSTLHRGDVKTLAVSSIAVASSIASPSLNQTHPPLSSEQNVTHTSHADHNAAGRECSSHRAADSAWQTAYSTARMVVDITKESSDMFLPLKAVVGALSVLIKNYDVSPIPAITVLLC